MSFFDDLKKPYVPPTPTPAPQRSRPTVQELLKSEQYVYRANQVLSAIKSACLSARSNGEHQIHGYIRWKKYSDDYSLRGDEWQLEYDAVFVASQNIQTVFDDYGSRHAHTTCDYQIACYHAVSREFHENIMTLLPYLLLKEGFPANCIHSIEFTYRRFSMTQKILGVKWTCREVTHNYGIGVDITW